MASSLDPLAQQEGLAFEPFPVPQLVGQSAAITVVKDIASSIARRRSTVMILGETGSGKEMLARHIHQNSDRAEKPFIPVDCSSLSDTLFESELFGHVRGAFTGAVRESLGFIRAADGGTLFLDEIGELSLVLQAKLLRVLQERVVVPVGDTRPRPVDIRVVCATNKNLADMVRKGTFREDLYFRLNVVVLHMPPLRDRQSDVIGLATHFLNMQASLYGEQPKKLTEEAGAALSNYTWPGNVRELANVMEHAHVLATGETIELVDLPDRLRSSETNAAPPSDLYLPDLERQAIAEAMRRTKNNKAQACKLLGMNIQRLNRRISRLGIRTAKD
jgi:Nif-specific regulatory protein